MRTAHRGVLGGRAPVWAVAVLALVALCPAVLADPTAARAAVEAVMRDMERAVLAGDKGGYVRHVSRRDPVFYKEQENWAADFDHHVPVAFALAINDEGAAFTDAEARFELVTEWRMGDDVTPNRERKVSFPVVFRKVAADGGGGGVWVYEGEDWLVLERAGVEGSGGARVMYFAGQEHTAEAIAGALPEVRAHVDEGFNLRITAVQEVKVYRSMRHLQHSIYLSYVDGLGGWNEPGESIKLLAASAAGNPRPVLSHEYGHVCTFELGAKASGMAWWVLEGVAELSSEAFRPNVAKSVDRAVRMWARNGGLAPWEEMADFRKTPKHWMGHVYTQGHHFVGYVSERWGREKRIAWLRAMAQGATLEDATGTVLGETFAEVDRAWRESLEGEEGGK